MTGAHASQEHYLDGSIRACTEVNESHEFRSRALRKKVNSSYQELK